MARGGWNQTNVDRNWTRGKSQPRLFTRRTAYRSSFLHSHLSHEIHAAVLVPDLCPSLKNKNFSQLVGLQASTSSSTSRAGLEGYRRALCPGLYSLDEACINVTVSWGGVVALWWAAREL